MGELLVYSFYRHSGSAAGVLDSILECGEMVNSKIAISEYSRVSGIWYLITIITAILGHKMAS